MARRGASGEKGGVARGARRRVADAHTYAVIDLGTNNCRMLIARPTADRFRVIDSFSRIVRLGEGVSANGVLSEAAMARTVEALGICAKKMDRRAVTRVRSVATEACRRAANCGDFLERVEAQTGIVLDIISHREEAQFALDGCQPLLDTDAHRALVFDIGGGSTELVWLRRDGDESFEMAAWTSLPCGVVTLAEDHGGDRISPAVYDAMVTHARQLLEPFDADHGIGRDVAAGGVQMLGTSGTVTTVAGVYLKLPRYNRAEVDGMTLSFADVDAVSRQLRSLDYAGRAAIPSIGPRRADLVVAGCAILEAIQVMWPVGCLRVADRGVREGMLMSMICADGGGAGWSERNRTAKRGTAGVVAGQYAT